MKLTSKKRDIVLVGSNIVFSIVIVILLWYAQTYHPNSWRWIGILALVVFILILLMMYGVPKMLEMRVENAHGRQSLNERLVLNGRPLVWQLVCRNLLSFVVMLTVYLATEFILGEKHLLFKTTFFMIGMLVLMSPMLADQIHRCIKNTYTIEGDKLLIDEWAWFQKKTDQLMVPIAEITSIRKAINGWGMMCNVEIEVMGINRILASGMVGEDLYNALKERML